MVAGLALVTANVHAEPGYEVDPKPSPGTPVAYAPVAKVPVTAGGITPDPRAVQSGLFIPVRDPVAKAAVPFTVTEPSGVARTRCPVRGAIPIYRGELKDPKNIRLLDEAGREIPVQALATSVWPEGTVKFLCIDFLTDLKAGETREYTLHYGKDVEEAKLAMFGKVTDDGKVTIDTGVINVTFAPGEQFCSKVSVKGKEITRGDLTGRLQVAEGTPQSAAKTYPLIIDEVKLVESGCVQATVYLKGSYGKDLSRTPLHWEQKVKRYPVHVFVRLYYGSGRMDVSHSFGYNGDEDRDFVKAYGLTVPMKAVGAKFVYGGDKGERCDMPLVGQLRLVQPGPASWQLHGPIPEKGKRFGGWASLQSPDASCVIGLRDAWQQWPVSLSANFKGDLAVDIYGADTGQFLDLRYKGPGWERKTGTQGFHKSKSMYTGDQYSTRYGGDPYLRAMGITKISELVLDFTPGADPASVGNGHHRMLVPWAGRKRYSDTRVLGLTGYYHDEHPRLSKAKDYFAILLDFPWATHQVNGMFGWVDWPDAPDFGPPKDGRFDTKIFGGGIGWTNGERQAMAYLGHYLASGWRRALDVGHQNVLHTIGIDIEHPGGDSRHGMCHRHSQVHWGTEGGPRQSGWRAWYMHYWLTGHNEVLRSLKELHYVPLGINNYGPRAKWPWHHSTDPKQLHVTPDQETLYVGGSGCTPFHYMNFNRWETTGEVDYARFTDFVMEQWHRNSDEGGVLDVAKNVLQGDAAIGANDPDNPPAPKYPTYYWGTYGGASLISEWAQLTGSKRAVDLILAFGDYHALDARGEHRIDRGCSDKRAPKAGLQLYRTYEGIVPAYALLRGKTHPERVERWKKAMTWRLFDYPYGGSPRRLKAGSKPLPDPEDYTADNWAATRVWCYNQNGHKIWAAQAMEALYTLWLLRPEKAD